MTLQLDRDSLCSKDSHQPIDESSDTEMAPVDGRPPDERHQALDMPIQIFERERAFTLRRSELHPRDEAAQVAVALTGRDEERKSENPALGVRRSAIGLRTHRRARDRGETSAEPRAPSPNGNRQLRSNDRLQSGTSRSQMKSRDAVHPVAIEQRDRGVPELHRARDERLGQRRPVEKGER